MGCKSRLANDTAKNGDAGTDRRPAFHEGLLAGPVRFRL